MENVVIEAQYPITFRKVDAQKLGGQLKSRHSVVLIGMKRVGISNFLRFFLYHKDIVGSYIDKKEKHLFIRVDLNDLVEREIYPFWVLTFKRIVDACENPLIDVKTKSRIEALFLDSIQSKDLFLLIDGIRKSLAMIVERGIMPTLFLIRFDRLKDAITPEFFANLQGLKDATHQKLSYVFTGVRSLDSLCPDVFRKSSLSTFAQDMYIKPAKKYDIDIVFDTYKNRYKLRLSQVLQDTLFSLVDGYIQYLQLALIFLHEQKELPKDKTELFSVLVKDERISLQSEELWESLTEEEQQILLKVVNNEKIAKNEKEKARYLWDTGFVTEKTQTMFSPLFQDYLLQKQKVKKTETNGVEFSKKEHVLFSFLKEHSDEICEREAIIGAVWPEVESLGVSDWAIDRLVARVRGKLKLQKAAYEIQTIKTRGYKLMAQSVLRE